MKIAAAFSLFSSRRFSRFLFAGGIAAGVNFGSRIILNRFVSYAVSIVIAYLIGMVTAFIIFKLCVFESGKSLRTGRELIGFTLVNLAGVLQTLVVSLLLADKFFPAFGVEYYRKELAHLIGLSLLTFTSFWGHKYISFRQDGQCD